MRLAILIISKTMLDRPSCIFCRSGFPLTAMNIPPMKVLDFQMSQSEDAVASVPK